MPHLIDKISTAHPTRRKIVFIHGKPRSGKSTLAKILTDNSKTIKIDGRGGLRSQFFLDKFDDFDWLDFLIIDDVNAKLDKIELTNLLELVSCEYIVINRVLRDPHKVRIHNVIVISNISFKKFCKNFDVDINRLFTDVIKIDSQQEFFQFLADKNLSIKEVLNPFKSF